MEPRRRLTLLGPLTKESSASADVIGLRYLGLPGRLNLTGIAAGDRLQDTWDRAFRELLKEDQILSTNILTALRALPNETAMEECANSLLNAAIGATPPECRGTVEPVAHIVRKSARQGPHGSRESGCALPRSGLASRHR